MRSSRIKTLTLTLSLSAALTLALGCGDEPKESAWGEDPTQSFIKKDSQEKSTEKTDTSDQDDKGDQSTPSDQPSESDKADGAGEADAASEEHSQPAGNESSSTNPSGHQSAAIPSALQAVAQAMPKAKRTQGPIAGKWSESGFVGGASAADCLYAHFEKSGVKVVSNVDQDTHKQTVGELELVEKLDLYAMQSTRMGLDAAARWAFARGFRDSSGGQTLPSSGQIDDALVLGDLTIYRYTEGRRTAYIAQAKGFTFFAIERDGESKLLEEARGTSYGAQVIITLTSRLP